MPRKHYIVTVDNYLVESAKKRVRDYNNGVLVVASRGDSSHTSKSNLNGRSKDEPQAVPAA